MEAVTSIKPVLAIAVSLLAAGAIFSGFGMVMTLLIPCRVWFQIEDLITIRHLENMAKIICLTGSMVGYAYGMEFFIAWYSGVEAEQTSFWLRAFGPYWFSTWCMITFNVIFPQLLWIKKLRTNVPFLFVLCVLINLGMWFERYVIVVTSLHHEYEPFAWGIYRPSVTEMGILLGSFCWFGFWFLLFTRLLPPIAIQGLKEVLLPPMRRQKEARS